MKVSHQQLEMALSKLKYELLGFSQDSQDLAITIEITQENPGNGVMIDCLTMKATKPSNDKDEGETSITVEVYPENEKLAPRASKTKSFEIKSKY